MDADGIGVVKEKVRARQISAGVRSTGRARRGRIAVMEFNFILATTF
jgi:hypothetical protein